METLTALSNELAGLVERVAVSVVAVDARPRFVSSGLIWRDGVVVTADHGIRREDGITVRGPGNEVYPAELAGRDSGTDLALLKVTGLTAAPLTPATEPPRSGAIAVAVSRAAATGACANMGVISGVSGPWQTWRGGRLDSFLRLDMALYPWSSGGAVVDINGALLGLATGGLSRVSAVAVPVSNIDRSITQLLEKGRIARGWLGVGLQPVEIPEHLRSKLPGAPETGQIVLGVVPGGPAAAANIVLGDVLLSIDGKPLQRTEEVQTALGPETVGKTVTAVIVRGGERTETKITVAERPQRPRRRR